MVRIQRKGVTNKEKRMCKKEGFRPSLFSPMPPLLKKECFEHCIHNTLVALRSLSKLCPTNMVSLWIILNSTACTSRMVVVTPRNDSSVTPLNLQWHRKEHKITILKRNPSLSLGKMLMDKRHYTTAYVVLLNSFQLNCHTKKLHLQTLKLGPPCTSFCTVIQKV